MRVVDMRMMDGVKHIDKHFGGDIARGICWNRKESWNLPAIFSRINIEDRSITIRPRLIEIHAIDRMAMDEVNVRFGP